MEFGERLPDICYRKRDAVYAVIFNENKKIAIIIHNDQGFLPGGGLEKGEMI
jgi:8-oxo-dGTP diphosphatase